jgi:putative membrane protein
MALAATVAQTAAPSLSSWSFDPPLGLVLIVAALYAIGDRRTSTPPAARGARRLQRACFYGGLAVVALALCSPIDAYSERLFWVPMVQHVMLLVLAPPLIVLAAPWMRIWRALPLSTRRALARWFVGGRPAPRALRAVGRTLGTPLVSFVAFSVVLLMWHVPALFDETLRVEAVHVLEHTLFFATALLFWKHVIDSPPLHAPLSDAQRAVYVVGAMVVSWLLAIVLALEPHALYAPYVEEASRPGGISALTDQQIAAGVMWVPGSITFVVALFVYVHRWLAPAAPARANAATASASTAARHGTATLAGDH